eukprot:5375262-Prymnesium_polylepis.1
MSSSRHSRRKSGLAAPLARSMSVTTEASMFFAWNFMYARVKPALYTSARGGTCTTFVQPRSLQTRRSESSVVITREQLSGKRSGSHRSVRAAASASWSTPSMRMVTCCVVERQTRCSQSGSMSCSSCESRGTSPASEKASCSSSMIPHKVRQHEARRAVVEQPVRDGGRLATRALPHKHERLAALALPTHVGVNRSEHRELPDVCDVEAPRVRDVRDKLLREWRRRLAVGPRRVALHGLEHVRIEVACQVERAAVLAVRGHDGQLLASPRHARRALANLLLELRKRLGRLLIVLSERVALLARQRVNVAHIACVEEGVPWVERAARAPPDPAGEDLELGR